MQNGDRREYFGFLPLDGLLQSIEDVRRQTSTAKTKVTPPIVELMSLHSGGGKTHLLYHLTALATLPSHLSGKQACAIIIDTDGSFSVPRLVAHIETLVNNSEDTTVRDGAKTKETIFEALKHTHIFRPQSLASTVVTLQHLPQYLFDSNEHHSFDRTVGFIAIDSASAFYWQDRAETEDAVFLASTSTSPDGSKLPPPASGYAALASTLKETCATFSCPAVVTTWYLGPSQSQNQHRSFSTPRSFRPNLPAPWSTLPTLRLVVQRVPVRKFPQGITLDNAMREADDRWKVVSEGKFECFVNEWGLDARMSQRLEGGGFVFRINADGIVLGEP